MTTQIDNELWQASLSALAQRDGAVELLVLPPGVEPARMPPVRVRVLAVNDGGVVVEWPRCREAVNVLRHGAQAHLLVDDGEHRWEMFTHVLGTAPHQLNRRIRLRALRLALPQTVQSSQRRAFFRVSTVGLSIPPVAMMPLPAEESPDAWGDKPAEQGEPGVAFEPPAPDAARRPVAARMQNISGSGAAVIVAPESITTVECFEWYWLGLTLPTSSTPAHLYGRRVHLRQQSGGEYRVGLAFAFHDQAHQEATVDALCRFTTWVQRRQLRNRRA